MPEDRQNKGVSPITDVSEIWAEALGLVLLNIARKQAEKGLPMPYIKYDRAQVNEMADSNLELAVSVDGPNGRYVTVALMPVDKPDEMIPALQAPVPNNQPRAKDVEDIPSLEDLPNPTDDHIPKVRPRGH